MERAVYNGDCINFTLETYYTIMSKSFNDLSTAGSSHDFNGTKNRNAFEQDLKDLQAIHWYIIWNKR